MRPQNNESRITVIPLVDHARSISSHVVSQTTSLRPFLAVLSSLLLISSLFSSAAATASSSMTSLNTLSGSTHCQTV